MPVKAFRENIRYLAVPSKNPYQNTSGLPVLLQKLCLFHIKFMVLRLPFKGSLYLRSHLHLWFETHPVAIRNQELEAVRTYPF